MMPFVFGKAMGYLFFHQERIYTIPWGFTPLKKVSVRLIDNFT